MAGHSPTFEFDGTLGKHQKIVLVTAQWHESITHALAQSAKAFLTKFIAPSQIEEIAVPGSFEIPFAVQRALKKKETVGVIAIGCIIEGETPHFHFLAQTVTQALLDLSLKFEKPVSNAVLTVHNKKQAKQRAGGKWGNKGEEAAASLLMMVG